MGGQETQETVERVRKIVMEQLGVKDEQVKPEARFVEDLGADSLDAVELIMELEEEFGREIPDADAEKIQTVGAMIEYLEQKLAQQATEPVQKCG